MSASTDNGGMAFPSPAETMFPGTPDERQVSCANYGMTLRDWFAGQALAGKCGYESNDMVTAADLAEEAYAVADAMIREREGKS